MLENIVNNFIDLVSAGKCIALALAAMYTGFKWLGAYMASTDYDLEKALKGLAIRGAVIIATAITANTIFDVMLNSLKI